MTAEVAVYNRTGIALAADSAASINGINSSKVFNNAEKLFALTKEHPVGVMIYGASEINGIPWELILKQYQKKYRNTSFDTLIEYANNFLEYTESFYGEIHDELGAIDDELLLEVSCLRTLKRINEISSELIDDDAPKDEAFLRASELLIDATSGIDVFDGFNETDEPEILKLINEIVLNLVEEYDLSSDSDCYQSILKLCCEQILKPDPFAPDYTGIVFAGYGEKEYFPRVINYETFGIVLGKIRKSVNIKNSVDAKSSAGLTAFAQRTEVESFMQGICNSIRTLYNDNFDEYREEICDLVDELLKLIPDKDVRKEKEKTFLDQEGTLFREMHENVYLHIQEQNIDKVVEMIEHLPKNELAYMAESLVNLTAFKRKVSNGQDSVGGPIDVAVISKGEGFVWIKRKHYFPIELNKGYQS